MDHLPPRLDDASMIRRSTLAMFATLALAPGSLAQNPVGAKVITFAAPPNITYPTGVAAAPDGAVFVAVDLNSSLDAKSGRGRIVRCEDLDGDGKADKFSDYVAKIDSPRGMCFVAGTLYVVHPPFLSAFRDPNGDGVAEEHEVLIKGLGFGLDKRGADHTSNGVRMGIDGWLYLAIGDYGMVAAEGTDGGKLQLDGGGVLRVRPDGRELELYTANTRNIYDVAVSPTLDLFARDNTNDGKGWNTRFHHLVQMADMGYPRLYKNFADEHLPALADYGGGSGTAAYYLEEPGIPSRYNDKVYTGDFTTKKVYLHPMRPAGGTFHAEQEVFFGRQAIDMDVDGNSAIYISDWHGGGYRNGKPDVGSISRITFPGEKREKFPDLAKAPLHDLISYLLSNSAVLRINAQQVLLRGSTPDFVRDMLRRLADAETNLPLHGRITAIFTLKQMFGTRSHTDLLALAKNASVREWALRALADRSGQMDGVSAEPFLAGLRDQNPRVVLQSLIGLARIGDKSHAAAILPLAQPSSGKDASTHAIPHIAAKALIRLGADLVCVRALRDKALRAGAIRALKELHTKAAVQGIAEYLETAEDPALRSQLFALLCRLVHQDKLRTGWKWWGTRPDDRGPYYSPVTWAETPRVRTALAKALARMSNSEQATAYRAMVRNRVDPRTLDLSGVAFDEVRVILNQPRIGTWAVEALANAAKDGKRSTALRLRAFRALKTVPGQQAIDARFFVAGHWNRRDQNNTKLVDAIHDFLHSPQLARNHGALRSRGMNREPANTLRFTMALNLVHSPLCAPRARKALRKFLASRGTNPGLLTAIGETASLDYEAVVRDALQAKRKPTARAAQVALAKLEKARLTLQSGGGKRIAELAYQESFDLVMKTSGDVKLGKLFFARAACIACHALRQDEPQKGPYLGNIGGKFDRSYLIQSILDPKAVVAQGFQSRWFKTKAGKTHRGFVTKEADGILELRDIAGVSTRLETRNIATRGTDKGSMMPPGLAGALTVGELASLLDFLQSLR